MKKIISILITIVLVCSIAFVSCTKQNASSKNTGNSKKTDNSVKTIKVATNATFPPYEFYDNEKPVGIDMDIMEAVCEKLGYKMEVNDMEFGAIINAVTSGKADVGAAAMTVTEDRKKSVNFTDSYATAIQKVVINLASVADIKSIDDLKNVKIGVQQDTTGDIYATDDFGEDHVVRYNKAADAIQALKTKKVQAVIVDDGPAKAFVEQNNGLLILPTAYTEEEYAFVVSKDNADLLNKINNTLQELKADGTIQKIVDKYISAN